jgi:hypothetical protein
VTRDDRGFGAQGVKEPDHVANPMEQRVLIDRFRPVGLPVSPHIGRHGAKPGRRQCRQLMPPEIPGFRESMT